MSTYTSMPYSAWHIPFLETLIFCGDIPDIYIGVTSFMSNCPTFKEHEREECIRQDWLTKPDAERRCTFCQLKGHRKDVYKIKQSGKEGDYNFQRKDIGWPSSEIVRCRIGWRSRSKSTRLLFNTYSLDKIEL